MAFVDEKLRGVGAHQPRGGCGVVLAGGATACYKKCTSSIEAIDALSRCNKKYVYIYI